jgi:hypothetical protein
MQAEGAVKRLRNPSHGTSRDISKYPNSKNFNLIDPDCLAEAAVDAHWSYEGNECNVMGFLFVSSSLPEPFHFALDGNSPICWTRTALHTL